MIAAADSRRHGFTLLEVIIAIGLVAALIGAMFAFLYDLLNARAETRRVSGQQQAAAILLESLENDLAGAVVGDSAFGAGVVGAAESIAVLTRSVPVFLADRGGNDPSVLADLMRVEYRFDRGRRELEARRTVLDRVNARSDRFHSLGAAMHRVQFRFYDGTAWRSTFDSRAAGQLPVAVEVALWFDPWPEGLEEEPVMDENADFRAAAVPMDAETGAEPSRLERFDDRGTPRPDRLRLIGLLDAGADEEPPR